MKKRRYCIIALAAVLSLSLVHGVSLAQDEDEDLSVYQWGPWSVMVMPAAGPPLVFAAAVQLPEGHDYHQPVEPPPVAPPPVTPPAPVLGYATHVTYQGGNDERGQFVWKKAHGSYREPADIMISDTLQYSVRDQQNVVVYGPRPWEGDVRSRVWLGNTQTGNTRVQGELIVGRTTAINVMEGLHVGRVIGTYTGNTLNNGETVRFIFDFGDSSGIGTFGTSFVTRGDIVGAQFDSSSVTAIHARATAEGTVTGSFFGNNAGVFGGLADVDITKETMFGPRITDHTEVFKTNRVEPPVN